MNAAAIRILAVAAVALFGLIGLVFEESLARGAGTEVILPMEAVDPRALLSGHYVTIDLRDTLPPGQACPPGTDATPRAVAGPLGAPKDATLWIALSPQGDRYAVAGAATDRSAAARYAPMLVRGTVACAAGQRLTAAMPEQPGAIMLGLGVDRFYASEDEAKRIDRLLAGRRTGQDRPVAAIVSIGKDGKARLKGLRVEGRRIELSLL